LNCLRRGDIVLGKNRSILFRVGWLLAHCKGRSVGCVGF
jgi:hypothetical protein